MGFSDPAPPSAPDPRATQKKKSTALVVVLVVGLLGVTGFCCLGIGGAIAIPAFINYVKRAKTAEAGSNLRELRALVEERCRATGAWPPAAGPVPSAPPGSEKVRGAFDADPVFRDLGFAPREPVYFSYAIVPEGEGVALVAQADLDADGTYSEFYVVCQRPCVCDARIGEESPLE